MHEHDHKGPDLKEPEVKTQAGDIPAPKAPEEDFQSLRGQTNQTYDGETDPAPWIKMNNQKRVYEQHGIPWPPVVPTVESLNPDSAEIGGEDITLTVTGTNFVTGSKIIFNNGEENTTIVSPTECTTIVKPSLGSIAIEVPVKVRNAAGESNELPFNFVEPEARSTKKGK